VVLAEDFHFPGGLDLPRVRPRVEVAAQWNDGAPVLVTLGSDAFLQSVSVDCPGFTPSDNYFHLGPGEQKHLAFSPVDRAQSTFHAAFAALNAREIPSVRAQRNSGDRPDETR
jgi:beta-mannosidase